jgi:hypothetical protein
VEALGDMCRLWSLTHPSFPRDGLLHFSDVCRRLAHDAVEALGIKEGWAHMTTTRKASTGARDKITVLLPHDLVRRARLRAAELSVASMHASGYQVHFQDVVKMALEEYLSKRKGAK